MSEESANPSALNASVRWLRSTIAATAFRLYDMQQVVVGHGWRGGEAIGGGLGCAACAAENGI